MHTIQVYLDESLADSALSEVRAALLAMPFVKDVVINSRDPHDLMVDYDEDRGMPMEILDKISNQGLHPDLVSG